VLQSVLQIPRRRHPPRSSYKRHLPRQRQHRRHPRLRHRLQPHPRRRHRHQLTSNQRTTAREQSQPGKTEPVVE
jgi:hypothetical protein